MDPGAYQDQQVIDPYAQDVQQQYPSPVSDQYPADQDQWQPPPSQQDPDQIPPFVEPETEKVGYQPSQEVRPDVNAAIMGPVRSDPLEPSQPVAGSPMDDPGTTPEVTVDTGSPEESKGSTKIPPPPDIPDL